MFVWFEIYPSLLLVPEKICDDKGSKIYEFITAWDEIKGKNNKRI